MAAEISPAIDHVFLFGSAIGSRTTRVDPTTDGHHESPSCHCDPLLQTLVFEDGADLAGPGEPPRGRSRVVWVHRGGALRP
jgi:hypothetical protein